MESFAITGSNGIYLILKYYISITMKMQYIDYKEIAEFCTVQQLTSLLGMSKQELKEACEKYGIKPRRNEIGDYGLVRYDVRRLHNYLYYESRGGKKDDGYRKEDDPWA